MSKEAIVRFQKRLTGYIQQVDPEFIVLLLADPTIGRPWEGMTDPEDKVVSLAFCTQEEMEWEELHPEYMYVVLAHEAGHVEQYLAIRRRRGFIPPPTELDAWRRGIKWAYKWGILERYRSEFILRGSLDLVLGAPHFLREDFERIRLQMEKLLGG